MDKEKALLKATINLDTIKAHLNRLKKPGYTIHSLDIDLLKTKSVELYDQILSLDEFIENRMEKPAETKAGIVHKQKHVIADEEPEVIKKEDEAIPKVEGDKNPEEEIEKEEAIVEDVKVTEVNIPIPKVEVVPSETQEEGKEESTNKAVSETGDESSKSKTGATTYDLFSESAESAVAERFAHKEEQSIADKMQKSQVTNIREAIGINEKFLFINELFNGDMGRYNKMLDDINSMTTKNGVNTFLLELKIQNQWSDDNEAFTIFREIIDRKFR